MTMLKAKSATITSESVIRGRSEHVSKIENLPANILSVDMRYQRQPTKAHYRRIASTLNPDALHVLSVSLRANGDYVVVDGQHRLMAIRELGQEDNTSLMCIVYENLTLEEEAELFRDLNKSRKTSAWNDFAAGLTQRDKECLSIQSIANSTGWQIGNQSRDGIVCCITTVKTIYRGKNGPSSLRWSLQIARDSWGDDRNAVEKNILWGLAYIYQVNGEEAIDRVSMIQKLSKQSPTALLARAKSDTRQSIPLYKLCASVITGVYNQGKRVTRIADI